MSYAQRWANELTRLVVGWEKGFVVGLKIAKPRVTARGPHPWVGPQCDTYAGRVFSLPEALEKMPLPCSDQCICWWRPLFRSDFSDGFNAR